jgi:uncharacterized membrane protein YedE/YeeE
MNTSLATHGKLLALGLFFGFVLGNTGFANWGEVHRMFTFQDPRLVLVFGGAVFLSGVGLALLVKDARTRFLRPVHPGTVPGGVLFGVGWALCGACPSIVLVQIGEGQLPALLAFSGALMGTFAYGKLHQRFFRWDPGSCEM